MTPDLAGRLRRFKRRTERQYSRALLHVVDATPAPRLCRVALRESGGRIRCQLQISSLPKRAGDGGNQNHWEPHRWSDGKNIQFWNDEHADFRPEWRIVV